MDFKNLLFNDIKTIKLNGSIFKVYLKVIDLISKDARDYEEFWDKSSNSEWEPDTFKYLNKYVSSDSIVIDIGAWIGPISLYLANFVKKCYSLEPDPVAFLILQKNINLNNNFKHKIIAKNCSISNKSGFINLYAPDDWAETNSNILSRSKNFTRVKTLSFTDFININKIEKIDFIKMDIEGAEYLVLPSLIDYLKKMAIKPLFLISFHKRKPKNINFKLLKTFFDLYKEKILIKEDYKINSDDILDKIKLNNQFTILCLN